MQSATRNTTFFSNESEIDLEAQQSLNRLKLFTPAERIELQKKLHRLRPGITYSQMEELLVEYRWSYRLWFHPKYSWSRWSNLGFPLYAAPNNNVGVQQTVQTFFPNITLSSSTANAIGYTCAGLSGGFYIAAIEPGKLAIRFTLEYALSKSYSERFYDFSRDLQSAPGYTLYNYANYSINQSILTATNLLQSTTSFLGVSAMLKPYPVAWWLSLAAFLFGGNSYFDGFSNDELWQNLNFVFDKKRPWLFTQFHNPALVLAVLVEGISTIVLKGVQAYSVADSARNEIGYCPSSMLFLLMTMYVSAIQFYPTTYDRYIKDKLQAQKELTQRSNNLQISAQIYNEIESDVEKKQNYAFPIRQEPGILWPLTFHASVGAFYGSSFGVPCAMIGAGAMLAWSYRAERQRILQKLTVQEILRKKDEEFSLFCANPTNVAADMLTFGGTFSNMILAIGQGKSVVGDSNWKMTGYLISTIGITFNGIHFAIEKIRSSFSHSKVTCKSLFSSARSAFFNCRDREKLNEESPLLDPAANAAVVRYGS